MKSLFVIFVSISLSFLGLTQNVYYGEHDVSTIPSLYFDMEGNLYPYEKISDSEMKIADGRLVNYYRANPTFFSALCASLNIENKGIETSLPEINLSLFNREMAKYSAKDPNVTFIIHGFRKSYKPQNDDETSTENFDVIMGSLPKGQERNFVRVFWDGLYDCCITMNVQENNKIFKLFEEARVNAENVGKSFGALLAQAKVENYTLLSFSLGAKVITAALPFIDKKIFPYTVTLVEPAIGGSDIKNALSKVERRNKISLNIIYNEGDFVLLKKDPKSGLVGPGPLKFGETTLGCNFKKEAEYTKQYFDNNLIKCKLVSFNFLGKTHSVKAYFDPLYSPLIWGY